MVRTGGVWGIFSGLDTFDVIFEAFSLIKLLKIIVYVVKKKLNRKFLLLRSLRCIGKGNFSTQNLYLTIKYKKCIEKKPEFPLEKLVTV